MDYDFGHGDRLFTSISTPVLILFHNRPLAKISFKIDLRLSLAHNYK